MKGWIPLAFALTLMLPPTGWARTHSPEVVPLLDASSRPVLEDRSGLSAGNLWLGERRMAGVTNRGFQQVSSDAGTPSLNVETRTVTQPDVPVQAAERDSVQQYLGHRIRGLGGSKHAAVRIPTKVVFGTLFCVVSTAISASLYDTYLDSEDETGDPWGGLDGVLYGLVVGGAVGFPVGVTLVDPDDSLLWTLLAGVIPAAAGTYLLASEASPATGFLLAWVSPPSAALVASELRRKPSEDHRTSFAIAPTPEGGLSAVAALRF